MASSGSRYQGKPLLRLLECYVLWAIGHLPEKEASQLRAMTPKLQSIDRVRGDWPHVIATAVQLPAAMPTLIRELWVKNTEIARHNHAMLTPQQFAEMFVDQNLASRQ
jgi:hypothetical protein